MDEGRRKVRICLVTIVLAAVILGSMYYLYNRSEEFSDSGGTLVKCMEVSDHVS